MQSIVASWLDLCAGSGVLTAVPASSRSQKSLQGLGVPFLIVENQTRSTDFIFLDPLFENIMILHFINLYLYHPSRHKCPVTLRCAVNAKNRSVLLVTRAVNVGNLQQDLPLQGERTANWTSLTINQKGKSTNSRAFLTLGAISDQDLMEAVQNNNDQPLLLT